MGNCRTKCGIEMEIVYHQFDALAHIWQQKQNCDVMIHIIYNIKSKIIFNFITNNIHAHMFIHLYSHKQSNIRRTIKSITQYNKIKTQKGITYADYRHIYFIQWYKDGKMHRCDGAPAFIAYFKNGQIRREIWYKDGKKNRPNGAPASIRYFENGQILNMECSG